MPPAQPLKIGIVGAGAIGSALAAQLALAGQPVSLVARGARRELLAREGVRLRNGSGELAIAHPAIITLRELATCDVVVVAVKAQALPELLPQLVQAMAPSALLMPAVNGLPWWYFLGANRFARTSLASLDPNGDMLSHFPAERLIGCVVYTRAVMNDDGDIIVHGEQSLRIGQVGPVPPPIALGNQLASAGVTVSVETDVRREVWRKLLRNASTNLVSGLTGTNLEQIGNDTGLLAVTSNIAREVAELAEKLGYPTAPDLDGFVHELRRAGPHVPSTLQDIRAGRALELDALAEAPLEVARWLGCHMPTLDCVLTLLRAQLRYANSGRRNQER
ncbi:2-dehydropantoate 2-reductase [Bradyrhizobium sp. SZCCHNPS2010]|uniref:ketopantoate reductase family protein n=1 Tax=Bradyrhizobium sp. SZCCHNPS2010 TaxID=3057333 RepID=UPI0029165E2E|nr:2-dehydropantoate 2-reductase [Bradyrhizobium sp. SZCCHNPS2010]